MPTTITGTDISTKEIDVDSGTLFVDSSNNRVGVGTSSPSSPVTINHTGSDGDVVSFEKDGSTVGSIGVDSNGLIQDGNRTDFPSFTKADRKHFFISDIRHFDEVTSSNQDQGVVVLCPKFLDDVFPVSGGSTARDDAPKMRLVINANSDYQVFNLATGGVYFGINVTVIPGLRDAGDESVTLNPEVVISRYAVTGSPRFEGGLVEVELSGTPWIGIEEGVQGSTLGGGQEGFHIIRYNMNMGIDISSNPDSILSDIRNDFVRHTRNLEETDIRDVADINITDNTGLYNP